MNKKSFSYKDAGVDIEKGDALVEKIKVMVQSTYGKEVKSGVGGFASLYETTPGRYLAAGTDGVGTKLLVAKKMNKHDTIGIDLVAMCVNDILCTGARPLFFMDYFATGKLNNELALEVLTGITQACKDSSMALIGGETAEMPDMYHNDDYDLAGFAVGEVTKDELLDGSKIIEGDSLLALASSGPHSNGYSLIRKLLEENEKDLWMDALVPTRIYTKVIRRTIEQYPNLIKGMGNITGGGVLNIPRMNENFDYYLTNVPKMGERAEIFETLKERSGLSKEELYQTFNMGMGLVIATSHPRKLKEVLKNYDEKVYEIGFIKKGQGEVHLDFDFEG